MPPKKKEQQIDLSTLPECNSLNIFLSCKGKAHRANNILSKVDSKLGKGIAHVTLNAVLDFAKQKNIYINPDTLTDKQKKDPKFMQSICTELTPQVLAKAVDGYINNLNIKVRVQKKAELDKPEAEREKGKIIDIVYVFDDFPQKAVQFQALAEAKQAVKFVFVLDPKISWVNAPEEPEPVEDEEQPQQPDEQYQRFKKMQAAEILTAEDLQREQKVEQKIQKLRQQRKKSAKTSLFRNTVIEYIKISIDPYAEEASIQQACSLIAPKCEQLLKQQNEFNNWLKDKKTQKLPQNQEEQQIKPANSYEKVYKDNTIQFLSQIIQTFEGNSNQNNQNQQIDFSKFDFDSVPEPQNQRNEETANESEIQQFLNYNQHILKKERTFIEQAISKLRYPGVDRFQVPETPPKSEGLRKLYRSTFAQFLPQNLDFHNFERKTDILFLQNAAKEVDEQRNYDFSNRIYEQQHTKESLIRQLNKALLFDESTLTLKYNENNDKLYLIFLQKNPSRRMVKKVWDCNWKVLPNFESWLKYFKQNETNINNNTFYDIDYELIGNIQEQTQVFSVKDAGSIVRKKYTVAGRSSHIIYCNAGESSGNLVFGIRQNGKVSQFYSQNQVCKITYTEVKQNQRSVFISFEDATILQFKTNGDVVIRPKNDTIRTITKEGYTIIHQQYNKGNKILHPNGGITIPNLSYVNEYGRGLKNQKLQTVPTLKKLTQNGQLITSRDDKTVIVEQKTKKWIKFPDFTQYLHQNGQLIIQKQGLPLFRKHQSGQILISYNGVDILRNTDENQKYVITFTRVQTSNKSSLFFSNNVVQVNDGKTETPYICDINETPKISKSWDEQKIQVTFQNSKYQRKQGQIVDPEQDEQNYGEQDVIKKDYLQPRIFVINNDSTGVELFSQNQIKSAYLHQFQSIGDNQDGEVIHRYKYGVLPYGKNKDKQQVFGIVPIHTQLNKKAIKKIQVQTDVFNSFEEGVDVDDYQKNKQKLLQVRYLIKHDPVTHEDRQLLAEINKKRAEWQYKSDRQQNQFGNKQRNDPSTLERFNSKKRIIEFRKMHELKIKFNEMKENVIDLYNTETRQKLEAIQNQRQKEERQKLMNRKKSYISQYKWKQPAEVQADENEKFYQNTSEFYENYFETFEGRKALSEMPDWVFRPKAPKKQQELDPEIRSQLLNRTRKQQQLMNSTNQRNPTNEESQKNQRYDTVQIEIKPVQQIYIKPSVFTKRQIDEQRQAFESQKKAYEYHQKKRKDFNLYGQERSGKLEVPSLMRTQPISQLNQKYLVTEAPVDKKVKISSMKNKLTSEASNMTEMRKQGPHANLLRTLDKGNDYGKLLQRRTMMVQADLNDRLQRDILINPIQANFGTVKEGGNYELKIQIKNEDVLAQRVQLKKPRSIFCKVQMNEMGPIALGMTRKISVFLKASPEIIGKFTDEFDIVTKHEIYHIPIIAHILSKQQFQSTGNMLSHTVRQFQEIGKKKREQLPPIK